MGTILYNGGAKVKFRRLWVLFSSTSLQEWYSHRWWQKQDTFHQHQLLLHLELASAHAVSGPRPPTQMVRKWAFSTGERRRRCHRSRTCAKHPLLQQTVRKEMARPDGPIPARHQMVNEQPFSQGAIPSYERHVYSWAYRYELLGRKCNTICHEMGKWQRTRLPSFVYGCQSYGREVFERSMGFGRATPKSHPSYKHMEHSYWRCEHGLPSPETNFDNLRST